MNSQLINTSAKSGKNRLCQISFRLSEIVPSCVARENILSDLGVLIFVVPGVVSKSKSKMAQNREVLGPKYHNGGVWFIRGDGPTFLTASGDHFEKCEGKRVRCTVAIR